MKDESRYLGPSFADATEIHTVVDPRGDGFFDGLSPRERQVLGLMLTGAPDKKISTKAGIGVSTVKTYIKRLLIHFEAHGRAELAAQYFGMADDVQMQAIVERAHLTPAETHVAKYLLQGLPTKQIARSLGVADLTIRSHEASILSKLGLYQRTELFMQVHGYDMEEHTDFKRRKAAASATPALTAA